MEIIQGPLAGYSCSVFRALVHAYSAPDFCCTEMISAKHLISTQVDRPGILDISPDEGLVCFQLAGNDQATLTAAARRATALGADMIDLNCGCPKPKIRKKNLGSQLLCDASHLGRLIDALREGTDKPISIKIRVDGKSSDDYNASVITVLQSHPVDRLIVHGRHWLDDYNTPLHLDQIAAFASNLDIPVIANGDVDSPTSLDALVCATGADGVMISRGSVGRPWLIAELRAALAGDTFTRPSVEEAGEIFVRHVEGLCSLSGERHALLVSRKLGKYYARHSGIPDPFLRALYQTERFIDLVALTRRFFQSRA